MVYCVAHHIASNLLVGCRRCRLISSLTLKQKHRKLTRNMTTVLSGRSKPWMKEASEISSRRKGSDLDKWCTLLDSLRLAGVACANIAELKLGSPLGFFNANFPKGGYKDKS